ncbi:hypothetical protein AAFF_G00136480 [Aldrovandia affinis]|uniref:Uncharacterized protein n=1 Tax=Aldrovandia affinis TaxID=143900 RepID=A0AAD7W8V7_9TELE|nr:hypothetical protein AAFF_G00136480 [Aldrovandia affinis]
MGPKKAVNPPAEDDMEEIRKSLNFMSEELSKVARQQTTLLELMNEMTPVRPEVPCTSNPREDSSSSEEEGETTPVTRKRLMYGPNEYRDEGGNPVNAKGGPLDCPFGNYFCEYGVRRLGVLELPSPGCAAVVGSTILGRLCG